LVFMIGFSGAQSTDSIKMGPGYANDVYYSLSAGEIKQEPNNNWQIAFSTGPQTSTILTNDGTAIELYTYPRGDTASWDTLSAVGIDTWTPQYNSPEEWMIGAFDRNALGHPDYGWGLYNQISHDVIGDSLFVIKLPDGSLKKLWIYIKDYDISLNQSAYKIRYANLDGSKDTTVMIDLTPFKSKNFAYYSLETHTAVDREPTESWDIVFTRYFDERVPYIVTGVLSNKGVEVARVTEADTASSCLDSPEFMESRSSIGYDWKWFNDGTFTYELVDSLVFVVKDTSGLNHMLYFSEFGGSSTGKVTFVSRIENCETGIEPVFGDGSVRAYPNPARNELYIEHDFQGTGPLSIQFFDMSGRKVIEQTIPSGSSNQQVFVNSSTLESGMYILRLGNNESRVETKIIVR